MPEQNEPNPKKGFPTSFLLFLIAIILIVVTLQNLMTTKQAKVSFSHQLEHLVNLQLIVPEENKKVSLGDNLVTFSGRFREKETEEGKRRFRFLELLNQHYSLVDEQESLESSLESQAKKVKEATGYFFEITGESVGLGVEVVDSSFNLSGKNYGVIVDRVAPQKENLQTLTSEFRSVSSQEYPAFAMKLKGLVESFRSSRLGIGEESIKQTLKSLDQSLNQVSFEALAANEQRSILSDTLESLSSLSRELEEKTGHVRFAALRSVRDYRLDLKRNLEVFNQLEVNTAQLDKAKESVSNVIWFFNNKEVSTRTLEKQDPETFRYWFANAQEEWQNFKYNRALPFKAPDQPRTTVLERTFKSEETSPNYISYFFTLLPIFLVLGLLYFVFSRQLKGMGGNAMNFGKSPARLLTKAQNKVTFKDVAGIDEAKEELVEIVEFLKNPGKFTALGGRIPKGVLCIGPPGTGKTLIAKAVAGEANRPFFSIAGSDFVEMFVGVGASRIRDMFTQAKKNAPCIIFIDEIDAVGRHRGVGMGGGHDEREQTLNQLLVEMDGFDTSEGVILMAATNRPDVLDKALLRPGRFDRRVVVGLPDIKGRFEILKVHARKVKISDDVDLMAIARATPGASGADLANLLNEAALLAAKKNRRAVIQQDLVDARDKILYGKERRSLEMDENEKKTTAYHESGHAIVGLCVEHADPVDKVTIIPRGLSLGATHFLPKKNRLSYWKKELIDQLAVLMGGRAAEEIFVGDISSGAQQDISQATKLVRNMVCSWGMSEELGLVAYDDKMDQENYYPQEKSYSPKVAEKIDHEVHLILQEAYDRSKQIILDHRAQTELMTNMLMEFETLDAEDVQDIIKGTWDSEKKKAKLKMIEETSGSDDKPPPLPKEVEDQKQDYQGPSLECS